MGIFNADVIINIPPAFFSLQKSGLVRVYLTSVFLLLSVPRCFGDQKPQFDSICVLCFDSFSFNKIDETNLLQEVHWFYSHLTFFHEGGKGEKFVFFVLG